MTGRRRIPTSLVLLPVLLVVAVGWLILDMRSGSKFSTGDPLIPFAPAQINHIEIRHQGNIYDIIQTADGWRLQGTVTDWASTPGVESLIEKICRLTGNASLPGSDPDDESYGFSRYEGFSVQVGDAEGREVEVAFGLFNTVTETYYAAGAGRAEVFTVAPEVRAAFADLPNSVRLHCLLPPFDRSRVDSVLIKRRTVDELILLSRFQGRWWLRRPAAGVRRLGTLVRTYNQYYDDRRDHHSGSDWLLANPQLVSRMLFEISETGLAGFGPPQYDDDYLAEIGLLPPLRQISFTFDDGRPAQNISFGDLDEHDRAVALRAEPACIVLAQDFARTTALLPVSELLHTGVFPFVFADVDSFHLYHEGHHLLTGLAGAENWIGVVVPEYPTGNLGENIDFLTADIVTGITNCVIEEVLPPVAQPHPLVDQQRTTVRIRLDQEQDIRWIDLRFGRLADGRSVAYYPETGVLLRIDDGILTSFRSLFNAFNFD